MQPRHSAGMTSEEGPEIQKEKVPLNKLFGFKRMDKYGVGSTSTSNWQLQQPQPPPPKVPDDGLRPQPHPQDQASTPRLVSPPIPPCAIKDGCGLYRLPVMDVMVEFQQLLGIGQQVVHHLAEPCLLRAKPRFLINAKEHATKVSIPLIFLRHFSYKDIKRATDGFHRIILNSSHGTTYKAKFKSGRLAMVKEIRGFGQEDDDFYREVQLLGCLHHRHIVALTGFSMGRKRFLVFESIENGSLKDHLNDPLRTPLNWRTRLHIAIGVAAALEYLHFFCEPPVYYVSISSSNIMLDENFNAKLSEVGLLGFGTKHTTLTQPSCYKESKGRVSGNVIYQLGLLILELITGQSSDEGRVDLIKWVQDSRSHKSIDNMIDPDLGNNYDSRELEGLLAVARLCIKSVDKPNSFYSSDISVSSGKGKEASTRHVLTNDNEHL